MSQLQFDIFEPVEAPISTPTATTEVNQTSAPSYNFVAGDVIWIVSQANPTNIKQLKVEFSTDDYLQCRDFNACPVSPINKRYHLLITHTLENGIKCSGDLVLYPKKEENSAQLALIRSGLSEKASNIRSARFIERLRGNPNLTRRIRR